FEFDLSGAVQLIEYVGIGLAREAADDLAHLARLEQGGQACVAVAGIVVDDCEIAYRQLAQAVDEFYRDAGGAESADEDSGAVLDALQGFGDGLGNFVDQAGLRRDWVQRQGEPDLFY